MRPPPHPTQGQAQDSENLQSYGTMMDQHLQLGEPNIQVQGAAAAVPASLLTLCKISICLSTQKVSMSHDTETDLTQQQGGCKRAEVSAFAMHVDLVNSCCCAAVTNGSDGIVKEFHEALQRLPDTAVAVAAIKVQCQLPPNHLTWHHQVQSLCLLKSAKLSNQHPTICWVYDCNRYPTLHCRK